MLKSVITTHIFTAVGCNVLALLLILSIWIGNRLQFKKHTRKRNAIVAMMITATVSCCIDLPLFIIDGHGGILSYAFLYIGKTWLYLGHLIVSLAWIIFLQEHLGVWKDIKHMRILNIAPALGVIFLVINFFAPVVFYVDSNNVYHRGPLANYFFMLLIVYALLGYVMLHNKNAKHGLLPFFPIFSFIIPMIMGVIGQWYHFGAALLWPSIAVAITGILFSLQNEMLYRDNLTGLYNRYYLDVYQVVAKRKPKRMMGIMLDLNSFKNINDVYGHAEGDRALVHTADILRSAVPRQTVIIRYAGDEFLILEESDDPSIMERYEDRIRWKFDVFSDKGITPYRLSASMGSFIFEPGEMTMDEFINKIDQNMYEQKKAFYSRKEADRRGK